MRAALNALAVATPDWVREHTRPEWFERYGRRVKDYWLPKGLAKRGGSYSRRWVRTARLLEEIHGPRAPRGFGRLPEVEILRRIW